MRVSDATGSCDDTTPSLSYTADMAAMGENLAAYKMTPTFATWGSYYSTGNMDWLDSSICGTNDAKCTSNPVGVFSAMTLTDNSDGSLTAVAGARAAATRKRKHTTAKRAAAPNKAGRRASGRSPKKAPAKAEAAGGRMRHNRRNK